MSIRLLFLILLFSSTTSWSAESKITITQYDGSKSNFFIKEISKILIVKDIVNVESISISEDNVDMKPGETYQVEYNISPENATNKTVFWSSSKNNVATVDNKGIITAVSEGNTLITAETEDGNLNDIISVVVSPLTSVEISSENIKIYPNPIQTSLHIDTGSLDKFEIVISDVSGNILHSQFDSNEIDFRNYPSGSYFLTLILNGNYHNFKLIKN